jgi:hypothetical protein
MPPHRIFEIIVSVHAICAIIANLTPTPKDNEALAGVYKIIEIFGGIVTKRAKQ